MGWTPISTMQRGARPDFTLLRQPGNSYTTKAQQWFLDQLLALEPGSEDVDGGGYAHKPGYHDTVAHNDARSGVGKDYSARDPEDRSGPRDKTRARDWTFRDAQAGNFTDFAKYGDRLLAAYRTNDPRLAGWREYLGRVSTPVTVNGVSTRRVGIDFRKRYLRIPDSTHDWHGHFSEDTAQVESFANKWKMLTALAGWSVDEWKQSIGPVVAPTVEDDMSEKASQVIEAWAVGKTATPTGATVEPVKWRIRDEAWQKRVDGLLVALAASVEGLDMDAVLRRLDEHAAAEATRDAELRALVQASQSGELTAEQVLTKLRDLLPASETPA